jgi:hypothetical protein
MKIKQVSSSMVEINTKNSEGKMLFLAIGYLQKLQSKTYEEILEDLLISSGCGEKRKCLLCQNEFVAIDKRKVFCSIKCQNTHRQREYRKLKHS